MLVHYKTRLVAVAGREYDRHHEQSQIEVFIGPRAVHYILTARVMKKFMQI